MPRARVNHVDLVVASFERSLRFYRGLLGPLGYDDEAEVAGERGEPIWYMANGRDAIAPGGYDRYRLGLHHLAFAVQSRDVVDERFGWLVEHGATIESEPREYHYLPGYYAVFFYDPDGIKLELVYIPERSS